MNQKKYVTYWLYYANEPLTSVRMPEGSTDQDVRYKALQWHDRVPLCDRPNENPRERRMKILDSEIRRHAR